MAFITENYHRLLSQQKKWGISKEHLFHAIENGMLRVCIWLPLRYVERATIEKTSEEETGSDGQRILRKLVYVIRKPESGFVGLRPQDCRMIFNKGRMKLRKFQCVCEENHSLRVVDEPPQPSISVGLKDIVILEEDRIKFEKAYKIPASAAGAALTENDQSGLFASSDYRYVMLAGDEFHLGDVQSRMIEQLHEAWQSKNPWVHSKTLLHISGSNATRIRDVFRNNKMWNSLIVSDRRGYYRINLPVEELKNTLEKHAA